MPKWKGMTYMRCGCPECGAYMIHSEGSDIACVCPQCGARCSACLGTNTVMGRDAVRGLKEIHDREETGKGTRDREETGKKATPVRITYEPVSFGADGKAENALRAASEETGRKPLTVYISVDMEGISGVSCPDYVLGDGKKYAEGCLLTTLDADAAVKGCFDGGAERVIVADMHASGRNMYADKLDSRALLLSGSPHYPRFPFLDGDVDGMILLGYHAMAGTNHAVLEHTFNSKAWTRVTVDGEDRGEAGVDAELAAEAGVPVIMVSGDDKLKNEADALFGGREEYAMVKMGIARERAMCLSPQEGRKRVYEAARRAVERLKAGEKFPMVPVHCPVNLRIAYKMVPDADSAMTLGAVRVDGYTVSRQLMHLSDAFGGLWRDSDGRPNIL